MIFREKLIGRDPTVTQAVTIVCKVEVKAKDHQSTKAGSNEKAGD